MQELGTAGRGSVGLHQQDTVPGQGAGGAGSEGMRLRLGTRQRDETGIRECGWLSLKKKKKGVDAGEVVYFCLSAYSAFK